ncbi:MAG: SIS domain-containing protein [Mesorhizobium sp.]|nr:SIS domain-containing protein [Mesorhizobium sp.]MBL8579849.1 SIS domain-containing protein [Mesorhizobium sp.]
MNDMMAREIEAQSELLMQIQPQLGARADAIAPPAGRVFIGGCGDSAFAPRALSGVFEALGQPFISRTSMELASYTRFESSDCVILSSISGGTKRTVEAAKIGKQAGARVIAITCNGESALAKAADETMLLPYQPLSRKTPHTLDYTVTLLALVELARSFSGKQVGAVKPVLDAIPQILSTAKKAATPISLGYEPGSKVFILGVGPDLGTAEYGAAKLHEAGGLIAFAAETENFVHGMNFMLEPNDTVIALGGSQAGLRRACQIADALEGWLHNCQVVLASEPLEDRWQDAFSSVLSMTFILQYTCLAIANALSLPLEEPRAGRQDGSLYLSIQNRLMAG